MAKAILLVRVSTVKQEILTQTKELVEYALADGYKKSDMIIIEGVGASAIKLNSIYLQEMEQLYKTIEENETSSLYAWEISRIGRNEEILMKFKNFLIDSVIDKILVTEIEKHHFKIEVKNKIGVICDSWFDYSSQGHKIHVEQIFSDGRTFDLTPQINANKRFERKRYEK